ncbi:C40 family peptidase [Pseudogracilibacillus sp. SO30301A]|uniref:C40 family peptidase n=1 Tax=Pseudogracilibacillus sp. SO30301A TaxID=3098291 RepID=UPI00300E3308
MKKKVVAIGAVAVVTLSGAFFSQQVHAETLQSVQNKQQEVKSQLSKAESKIADILYEIKEINEEISKLQYALEENQKQIDKTEEQITNLDNEIDELNEKIEQRNEILKNRIASYQENGGQIDYMEVVLGSEGFSDFVSRISAVTTITKADMDLLEENEQDKKAVEEKLKEQEELAAQLEEQHETIEAQKEQEEAAKTKLKEKEEKLKKDKAKLESESSELANLEAEIRASMVAPVTQEVASATENSDETGHNVVTSDNSTSNNSASNNSTSNNGTSNTGTNNNSTSNNSTSNNSTSNSGNSDGGSSGSKTSQPKVAYTGGGGSAIAAGRSVIGTPYVWGGTSPGGFDCSGFVHWAYKQEGVNLPRTASAMASVGTGVPYSQAKPGDLVIFRGGGHVGIYLGGGKFLGAQNSTGVAIADMNSGYWKNNFDGIVRRVK